MSVTKLPWQQRELFDKVAIFSSFKQDFSTRIVMETTLGLFMDHKDYGGTNFAILFRKSKNHGSAVCS